MASVRVAVLALFWGSTFLWIKISLEHGLSPIQISVIRCALGALVLAVIALAMRQRLPGERALWGHLLVAALLCNALPFALFGIGEQTVASGTAGVVHSTTPLWSLAIGMAVGTDRRLNAGRMAGLVIGFAGTALIFAPWDDGSGLLSLGALAILGAAASYAIAFAYMGRFLVGRGDPVAISAAQLGCAMALSAVALPVAGVGVGDVDLTAIAAVTVLGIFATGLTFYLNYRIIMDEGATAAATVGYLLPVVSLALGALVLDEHVNGRILAGMVVVLLGVALTRRAPRAGTPLVPARRRVGERRVALGRRG